MTATPIYDAIWADARRRWYANGFRPIEFTSPGVAPYVEEIRRLAEELVDAGYGGVDPMATSAAVFALMVPTANPEQYR